MSTDQADAITKELQRRTTRLNELCATRAFATDREASEASTAKVEHVRGEVIGLRGALGILLGGTVPGGEADQLAFAHYQQWLAREALPG